VLGAAKVRWWGGGALHRLPQPTMATAKF
jgi:hypothetical protein